MILIINYNCKMLFSLRKHKGCLEYIFINFKFILEMYSFKIFMSYIVRTLINIISYYL